MEIFSSLCQNTYGLGVFVCYMGFCIAQGILVTATQKNGTYNYQIVTVVLLTEVSKLFLACLCYIRNNSLSSLWYGIRSNIKVLCLYLVPSFLYCIYNNLSFINLTHFDPTSYFILLQLRIVATGICFQIIFSRKLSKIQWISLGLLTCGCIVQQIDWDHFKTLILPQKQNSNKYKFFSIYFLFIIVQTLCSCFAGVYNEHILKESGANVNIFIQNMFMYIDSIFWNILILLFQSNLVMSFSSEALHSILQLPVIAIILNNSLVGITTSLFLKNFNSILKNFASALEISFTAVLSWIIFSIEIKLNTVIAIITVSYSLYLYSKNPMNNQRKVEDEKKVSDKESLLLEV